MDRAYYSNSVAAFCADDEMRILGLLAQHHSFALEDLQRNAWIEQIHILKNQLKVFDGGYLLFEYAIPRMGKRVDVVFIYRGIIYILEFKVGETYFSRHGIDQVLDYCLDLKNFHAESHDRPIVPILVATNAVSDGKTVSIRSYEDKIFMPIGANSTDIEKTIRFYSNNIIAQSIDPFAWKDSLYKPTPTIIEAAQSLYRGHNVKEISRSDAGAINLSLTSEAISMIIEEAKDNNRKSICFVTGVPGAGKTLAGLNIANDRLKADENEHAVFLSGNGPLVDVLREALARDDVLASKEFGKSLTKKQASIKARAFIQNIHHFRDDALQNQEPPIERVVVFDEAQRAWTLQQTAAFMKKKKGMADFSMSEPEFLISVLDRHIDWAVIICLIGGGQEINTGEAGLPEWFSSLRNNFPDWHVYVSDKISDFEYTQGQDLLKLIKPGRLHINRDLHLATSVRSFRSEKVSEFVKLLLDGESIRARNILNDIKKKYPIVITRDILKAKKWLREYARGNERYGILASSGGKRLKPFAINVDSSTDVVNWFLNTKDDIRSSYFLEEVATEFEVQGLELDWSCVAWDADLRYSVYGWQYKSFRGTVWQNVNDNAHKLYLKNAYRVLLTRARQGMVIFVPNGDEDDYTRSPEYYDGTFNFLKKIGLEEI